MAARSVVEEGVDSAAAAAGAPSSSAEASPLDVPRRKSLRIIFRSFEWCPCLASQRKFFLSGSQLVEPVEGDLLRRLREAVEIVRALDFDIRERLGEFAQRAKIGVAVMRGRNQKRPALTDAAKHFVVIEGERQRIIRVKAKPWKQPMQVRIGADAFG